MFGEEISKLFDQPFDLLLGRRNYDVSRAVCLDVAPCSVAAETGGTRNLNNTVAVTAADARKAEGKVLAEAAIPASLQ